MLPPTTTAVTFRIKIPQEFVAKVMGQHGVTIKKIQETCKSKLAFEGPNKGKYVEGRVLSIKARTPEDAQKARKMVEEICGPENIQNEVDMAIGQKNFTQRDYSPKESIPDRLQSTAFVGEPVEDEFLIPSNLVAHVVGKDDSNLKSIQTSLSLVSIEMLMPFKTPSGENFCPIAICGSADKVEEAKIMLQRMLNCFVPKASEDTTRLPVSISPSVTFVEEYHQPPNKAVEAVHPVEPAVENSTASSVRETLASVSTSPVRETKAQLPMTSASVTPVQNTPALIQAPPASEPIAVNQKTVSPPLQEAPTVLQSTPVRKNLAPAQNTAFISALTQPDKVLSPVKEITTSNIQPESSLKRPLAFVSQEEELKLKVQRKQLKMFEEQKEYLKKRSLLVEKQLEQIEMENYAKKTQLGVPATLSIQYNGQTIHIKNKFAEEQ